MVSCYTPRSRIAQNQQDCKPRGGSPTNKIGYRWSNNLTYLNPIITKTSTREQKTDATYGHAFSIAKERTLTQRKARKSSKKFQKKKNPREESVGVPFLMPYVPIRITEQKSRGIGKYFGG